MAKRREAQLTPKQMDLDAPYLMRAPFIDPSTLQPILSDAYRWRLVASEPVNKLAINLIRREVSSLNWEIKPKSPEYEHAARYYTDVFSNFRELVSKTLKSILELPQGGAWEVGWIKPGIFEYEEHRGTVAFVDFIDAGTLYPTNPVAHPEHPIVQMDPRNSIRRVMFKKEEIVRILAYPFDEWDKEWWQASPTYSSFMAIEALSRIYIYYLKQLRDTPPSGILDMMDFSRDDVQNWVKSFREMLEGIDPIKIPVLYEHSMPANWIQLGRNPQELFIPQQFKQYAEMVLGNYGLRLNDVGLNDQGETKSGAAVRRRVTMQGGISFFAELIKDAVQGLLPWYLSFGYTDPDVEEERSRAQIRAADSRTIQTLNFLPIRDRVKQSKEWGLISIDVDPEAIEKEFKEEQDRMMKQAAQMQALGKLGGSSPLPGQLQEGEGKVNNGLQDDAKLNASRESELFTKSVFTRKLSWRERTNLIIEKAMRRFRNAGRKKLTKSNYGVKNQLARNQLSELAYAQFKKAGERITLQGLDTLLEDIAKLRTNVQTVRKAHDPVDDASSLEGGVWDEDSYKDMVSELIGRFVESLDEDGEWAEDEYLFDLIKDIYKQAYEDGLLAAAEEMQKDLYNSGRAQDEYISETFNLVSEEVKELLKDLALDMVRNINEGTRYYLRQMISRGIEEGLDTTQITAMIKAELFNIDAEDIDKLVDDRIRSIVNTEINRIDSKARIDQMSSVGLKNKRWITRGLDVCPVCIYNESQGVVPLDFVYEDVFKEGTLAPPAHPSTCHCTIGADKDELALLESLEYWTGE